MILTVILLCLATLGQSNLLDLINTGKQLQDLERMKSATLVQSYKCPPMCRMMPPNSVLPYADCRKCQPPPKPVDTEADEKIQRDLRKAKEELDALRAKSEKKSADVKSLFEEGKKVDDRISFETEAKNKLQRDAAILKADQRKMAFDEEKWANDWKSFEEKAVSRANAERDVLEKELASMEASLIKEDWARTNALRYSREQLHAYGRSLLNSFLATFTEERAKNIKIILAEDEARMVTKLRKLWNEAVTETRLTGNPFDPSKFLDKLISLAGNMEAAVMHEVALFGALDERQMNLLRKLYSMGAALLYQQYALAFDSRYWKSQ